MKRRKMLVAVVLAAWLASGLYIVRGNERAVVRRCGKAVADADGRPRLVGSGLHFDLPWPFSTVDRVNLHEIRTVTLGTGASDEVSDAAFLREFEPTDRSQVLTGDRNILHVKVDIQYRIAADGVGDFLFATVSPERRLQQLAEAALTDLVTRAGVDAVHTYGRAALQRELGGRLLGDVVRHRLGIEIESVAIDDVRPPIRVKAAFLDVNDARADREKFIQSALASEQQSQERSRGEARRLMDEAETYRDQEMSAGRASAESFERIVKQLRTESDRSGEAYATVRKRALQRRYYEDLQQILSTVSSKVVLETGRQVDVTIVREPGK